MKFRFVKRGSRRSFNPLQALLVLLFCMPPVAALAQLATEVELQLVLSGLPSVVDLQSAGDSRLFAVSQGGTIHVINFDAQGQATLVATPFLDLGSQVSVSNERGLLGLAFHPEYDSNGYFYVNYSCVATEVPECVSDGDTIIARFSVSTDPDSADAASRLVMATIAQDASNHNGGQLQFEPFPDPGDGRTILYIAMGDGGGGNDPNQRAQDLDSLLGKMLRVDVDNPGATLPRYNVPTDNPVLPGSNDEIWAYGLRNPWRFSFDRLTGDIHIADVGQNAREEINFQAASSSGGENYGWRQCEGTRVNFAAEAPDGCTGGGGLTPPILEYSHGEGCFSVTGGYVYRGSEFDTEFGGTYFYADYCTGELWGARPDGGGSWSNIMDQDTGLPFSITTFGERHNGELYLGTGGGSIYRVRPPSSPEPDLVVNNVDGPLYGFKGGVINVANAQAQNQGGAAAGANGLGYYFSTDPVNNPDQNFSGTDCPVPALDAGALYNCDNIMVDVPDSLAAGSYSLVAIIDDQDLVAESNETNNDRADNQLIEIIDCDFPEFEVCDDGIDNDCDGFVDGSDSDCQLACAAQGDSCTINSDCCSNKCRGGRNKSCKGDPICTPTENPEVSCIDGIDNDCDGLVDTDDPDCQGPCNPTEPVEVSCDDGLDNDCDGLVDLDDPDCPVSCAVKGDACSLNSDCCSNKCRGPSGGKSCK
ncbi:MAG: hypothetical protein HKO64_12585 [Xanthomonadales bacterium]|nr:hypothetical protein [Xanthomonadales bacterium]NNL96450.1 hypothetical protein [Xanthomonadales bacterium]